MQYRPINGEISVPPFRTSMYSSVQLERKGNLLLKCLKHIKWKQLLPAKYSHGVRPA